MSDADLAKELEDLKAIDEQEKGMKGSPEDEEEENEVSEFDFFFISQVSCLLCGAEHPLPSHKHRRTQHPEDYLVIPIISVLWP